MEEQCGPESAGSTARALARGARPVQSGTVTLTRPSISSLPRPPWERLCRRRGEMDHLRDGRHRRHRFVAATVPAAGAAKVVIEQAMAAIDHTTPELFQAAQAMLEKAIAAGPTMSTSKRHLPRIFYAAFNWRGTNRPTSPPRRAAPGRCWSARCGQADLSSRARRLLPLPRRDQRIHRKPGGLRQGLELRPVGRAGALPDAYHSISAGTLRGCAGDIQASRSIRYATGLALGPGCLGRGSPPC